MRRGAVAMLLAGCLSLVPAAATAATASDELGLSRDGRAWSASLGSALFDSAVRWVPGDVRTESFFVRNQGPSGGELVVAVRESGDEALTRSGDLAIETRVADGPWHSVNGRTSPTVDRLQTGERARVDVRVALAREATNQTQTESLALLFDVVLAEDLSGSEPGEDAQGEGEESGPQTSGAADGQRDAALPGTGAPEGLLLLVVALLALAGGVRLVAAERAEVRDA